MRKTLFNSMLLTLFMSQNCTAQDTTALIKKEWTTLKSALQRRTDVIPVLTNVLIQASIGKKNELKKIKDQSAQFFFQVNKIITPDSLSIALVSENNSKLTQLLTRTFVSLENDKKFKSNREAGNLITQLDGCDNRINVARFEYNRTCKKYGRTDLLFQVENADDGLMIDIDF